MYLPVPGIEPTSSVFLGKCVTHLATVRDTYYFSFRSFFLLYFQRNKTLTFIFIKTESDIFLNSTLGGLGGVAVRVLASNL